MLSDSASPESVIIRGILKTGMEHLTEIPFTGMLMIWNFWNGREIETLKRLEKKLTSLKEISFEYE